MKQSVFIGGPSKDNFIAKPDLVFIQRVVSAYQPTNRPPMAQIFDETIEHPGGVP